MSADSKRALLQLATRARSTRGARSAARRPPVASAGGTWLALVAGFGGLRDSDGEVHFTPRLPEGWAGMRFRVQVRGQLIEVEMTPGETSYRLVEGRGLLVHHAGEELRLAPGEPVRRPETPVSALESGLPLAA